MVQGLGFRRDFVVSMVFAAVFRGVDKDFNARRFP